RPGFSARAGIRPDSLPHRPHAFSARDATWYPARHNAARAPGFAGHSRGVQAVSGSAAGIDLERAEDSAVLGELGGQRLSRAPEGPVRVPGAARELSRVCGTNLAGEAARPVNRNRKTG